MKMNKLPRFLSTYKTRIHFIALLLMTIAPIIMYLGASGNQQHFVILGLFMMVIANLMALATK